MTDLTNNIETETETNRANPNGTNVWVASHNETAIYLDAEGGRFYAVVDSRLLGHESLELLRKGIDTALAGPKLVRPAVKVPVRVYLHGEVQTVYYVGVHTKAGRSTHSWLRQDGREWDPAGYEAELVKTTTDEARLAELVRARVALDEAQRVYRLALKATGLEALGDSYAGTDQPLAKRIERQAQKVAFLAAFAPPAAAASEGGAL